MEWRHFVTYLWNDPRTSRIVPDQEVQHVVNRQTNKFMQNCSVGSEHNLPFTRMVVISAFAVGWRTKHNKLPWLYVLGQKLAFFVAYYILYFWPVEYHRAVFTNVSRFCLTNFLETDKLVHVTHTFVVDSNGGSGADCLMANDSDSYDVWLSVKSTADNSGSIIIYSYEEHECVAAKVLLQTFYISYSLSPQHCFLYFADFSTAVKVF